MDFFLCSDAQLKSSTDTDTVLRISYPFFTAEGRKGLALSVPLSNDQRSYDAKDELKVLLNRWNASVVAAVVGRIKKGGVFIPMVFNVERQRQSLTVQI